MVIINEVRAAICKENCQSLDLCPIKLNDISKLLFCVEREFLGQKVHNDTWTELHEEKIVQLAIWISEKRTNSPAHVLMGNPVRK